MKHRWMKRALGGILSVALAISAFPVSAAETGADEAVTQTKISPLAAGFDENQLNPEYLEWLKNGKKGAAPSMQDFSYLAESYVRLNTARNAALLPAEYDLRDYGRVTPVINQGLLNLCWAVAASDATAGTLLEQFPQIAFSATHTAWFSKLGAEEYEYFQQDTPYDYGGTDGVVVGSWAAWKGPVVTDLAPDEMLSDDPEVYEESDRWQADYHLQDAYYLPFGLTYNDYILQISQELTKQLLMEEGPLTISYYAADESAYREDTFAWYNDEHYYANHTVVLVGWDDDYPKENFAEGKQPEQDGAWLVQNSWGTDWGDDGYFWISYEDASLESGPTYRLEEADNYATNYQYDTIGWCLSFNDLEEEEEENLEKARSITAANIFTAQGEEQLEAVSFYTTDAQAKYTVSIYTGVEEGQPQSGVLQTEQSGTEPYAGYHTIELEQPVKLNQGERFSIVLSLENPIHEYPLAIEAYDKSSPEDVPQYMGNGGESYVLMEDGWEDVVGYVSDSLYITNVCIKGFTNPLPQSGEAVSTVRFSQMEGPLADGTQLALSANGADEIYYSVDGSEYQLYTQPLSLDLAEDGASRTVCAYAVSNGSKGNLVEKTYTKAAAQLTDLALQANGQITHYETNGFTAQKVMLPEETESVQVMAQSCDTIYVNGTELPSSDWSGEIALTPGETTTLAVTVEGDGKTSTTYTFLLYRSVLNFDYQGETIRFDEAKYQVEDFQGNPIHSGDSITHLIAEGENTLATVTTIEGKRIEDYIPGRLVMKLNGIDYYSESTIDAFSEACWYSLSPDMSDAVLCNGSSIFLTPGVDIYIQRRADDTQFSSAVYHLSVPDRPPTPEVEVAETTQTTITMEGGPGVWYSANGGQNWQESPVFTGLTPGEIYRIGAILPATLTSFSSEIVVLTVQTAPSSETPVTPNDPEQTPENPEQEPENTPEPPSSEVPEADAEVSETDTVQTEIPDQAQPSPSTEDETNLPVWMAVLLLSGSGLMILLWKKKKQR